MATFKSFLLTVLILSSFIYGGCIEKPSIETQTIEPPKFHTFENEGYWKNKADDHLPIITFTSRTRDIINVHVPMVPTKKPRHYIEVICLMQGEKQIDSKKFEFSFDEPRAQFKLPDPASRDYWVLIKCNLHDMWKGELPYEEEKQ
jgi:desulfoferrodoxin (superoxide reductase-like protein)